MTTKDLIHKFTRSLISEEEFEIVKYKIKGTKLIIKYNAIDCERRPYYTEKIKTYLLEYITFIHNLK